jgi:hypothetical protein
LAIVRIVSLRTVDVICPECVKRGDRRVLAYVEYGIPSWSDDGSEAPECFWRVARRGARSRPTCSDETAKGLVRTFLGPRADTSRRSIDTLTRRQPWILMGDEIERLVCRRHGGRGCGRYFEQSARALLKRAERAAHLGVFEIAAS